jgi:hypothetical protein
VFQQFEGRVINEIMRSVALYCLILFDVGFKLLTAFGKSMPGLLARVKLFGNLESVEVWSSWRIQKVSGLQLLKLSDDPKSTEHSSL